MGVFCACGGSTRNANTGVSSAMKKLTRASGYILMWEFADDGTKNQIVPADFDADGNLPDSFVQDKISHIDPTKRWYFVTDVRNVVNERAEPVTESFEDGRNNIITNEGIRTVNAETLRGIGKYRKNFEKLSCENLAFFEIDSCGSIGGETEKGNEQILIPHPIAFETLYANLMKAQDGNTAKIMLQWEYDQRSQDGNECMIPDENIVTNLQKANSLLNLIPVFSNVTGAGFTVDMQLEYGGFNSREPVTGLVAADFTAFNITDNVALVIDTWVADPSIPGRYAATFGAAIDPGDVFRLNQAFTGEVYNKKGFELEVIPQTAA